MSLILFAFASTCVVIIFAIIDGENRMLRDALDRERRKDGA